MLKITITEGLAKIKTIGKRIEKKRDMVTKYLCRQNSFKDPFEADGGSKAVIAKEIQAINDLLKLWIGIRNAIKMANQGNAITVKNTTRSISEWLIWKREIMDVERAFLNEIFRGVTTVRTDSARKGLSVVDKDPNNLLDVIINVDEKKLTEQRENLEEIIGDLDGQLSLKNATILIEVED
jgi:hypothetical protein